MGQYMGLVTARVWDSEKRKMGTSRVIIYADSFADAGQRVDELFGNESDEVKIELFDQCAYVDEDVFEMLRKDAYPIIDTEG